MSLAQERRINKRPFHLQAKLKTSDRFNESEYRLTPGLPFKQNAPAPCRDHGGPSSAALLLNHWSLSCWVPHSNNCSHLPRWETDNNGQAGKNLITYFSNSTEKSKGTFNCGWAHHKQWLTWILFSGHGDNNGAVQHLLHWVVIWDFSSLCLG